MKKDYVTIIIPAKNEELSVTKTLSILEKTLKIPYKIVVINDHSSDNTAKNVTEYIRKKKNIILVHNSKKRKGFSAALKTGFEKTRSEFVIPVMADLCDEPKTINVMYKKTKKDWDIICGSRYVTGGKKIGGPFLQGVLSYFVCYTLHKITGIPTTDISNAFKMYRKSILKKVFINEKSGVEVSMEITMQAFFNGAKIVDVPTVWRGRTIGKSKFKIFERAPLYFHIYKWALLNSIRKRLHLPITSYS